MGARDASDTRAVLAFFTSAHSGPGRRMEGVLTQLARKERARVRIEYIDVDQRPQTAMRLEVGTVPTLVLIRNGRVLERLEGRSSASRIEALLDRHLGGTAAAVRLSA